MIYLGEIMDKIQKGYTAKHNHESLGKMLLGIPGVFVSPSNLMVFHHNELLTGPENHQYLKRLGGHLESPEFALYLTLLNPPVMTETYFHQKFGDDADYSDYKHKILVEYREFFDSHVNDLNQFQESIYILTNKYLDCFPQLLIPEFTQNQALVRLMAKHLMDNLGIKLNPDGSIALQSNGLPYLTWDRIVEYSNPNEMSHTETWYSIGMKSGKYYLFDGVLPIDIEYIILKIDRRLQMVVNNPHIQIDKETWGLTNEQYDILNRLRMQAVYFQNKMAVEFNTHFQTLDDDNNGISYMMPMWFYSGIYNGVKLTNTQFLETKDNPKGLPTDFEPISYDEIIEHFM